MWRYRIGLTAAGLAVIVILRRRYAVVTVEGSSMQPTLHEGDRVLVRRTGIGQLRRGQVIVAEDPGRTGLPAAPVADQAGRRRARGSPARGVAACASRSR